MTSGRRRYAELLRRSDPPLAEAAAAIALLEYPDLDLDDVLAEIEGIVSRVRSAGGGRDALDHVLFRELGFHGNQDDYYDPRNSYLNDVLRRRTGIPITLSVLYVVLARKLGLDADGVSFPGHFLVRVQEGAGFRVVDPFDSARPLDETALEEMLTRAVGPTAPPGIDARLLEPAPVRVVLARMLANLKAIHLGRGEAERALEVLEWQVLTVPGDPSLRRDRGILYFQLQCLPAAEADLRAYLDDLPDAPDRLLIENVLERIAQNPSTVVH